MHMRYHLVKFVQENFQLVDLLVLSPLESRNMTLKQYVTKMAIGDTCGYEVTLLILSHMFKVAILVIRSDMLWISQNVRPTECPIVLVQNEDGSFLGTRTKKPVFIGDVPRIRLTVKKHDTQHITHSTLVRKRSGNEKEFQPLASEIFSPIVEKDKVQSVHSDHSYSVDSKTNKVGESSGEFIDLVDKHSMSTEYPEESVVEPSKSINSEEESAALVDYPALDGTDGMGELQSNIVDGNKEPESQISDDGQSSGTEEIDVDNCESDGSVEAERNKQVDMLEDGQRILPSDDGVHGCKESEDANSVKNDQKILPTEDGDIADQDGIIDPDMTIDPNATIDPTAAEERNELNEKEAQEDVPGESHDATNNDNVIVDTESESKTKRKRLGIFGPQFKRRKLSVKLHELSVDLAMPINKEDVVNVQKEDESEESFIVQYCCNKCQQRTFTMEGYETHLFHAHQIRNGEKYPPTMIRKAFKSPESLHLDSVSSSNNETKEGSEEGSDEDQQNIEQDSEEQSPNKMDVQETNNGSEADMPEKNKVQEEGNNNNELQNEAPGEKEENPINDTTESGDANYIQSSESEPLMYPHFSQQFETHPDKPTIQCPECPEKFFYQGGLRHHLETHESTREKPTFQCPDCTDKFFYKSGLDHHYETHVRQKRRESGLYSEDDNNNATIDPVPKENKGRGKKRGIVGKAGKNVVGKKGKKSVDSAIERNNEMQSINSTEEGDSTKKSKNSASTTKPKRGRGRPRKIDTLPKRHRGKKIKTESDLNTSEDTERQ